jgi:hypothetical protein
VDRIPVVLDASLIVSASSSRLRDSQIRANLYKIIPG